VNAALLDDVCTHHQIGVPVTARVGAVRSDAADLGRKVDDELGPGVGIQPLDVRGDREVVVAPPRDERVEAVLAQPRDEV